MGWTKSSWPFARLPYAVQSEALARGADKARYGYWVEQGLGKTGIDMACFLFDLQNDYVDAHCVITQSYLKSNWTDEAEAWGLKIPLVLWPNEVPASLDGKPHILVMNQEAVLYGGGKYLYERLRGKQRYSISCDDASIKNFNGIMSKTIRTLASEVSIRRDLCGTPMSQTVMDLYPRLRLLGELNGWNPYQYRNMFAIMGGYMGKKVVGARNEEKLHEILAPVTFRALKRDWWKDMPEKIYLLREFEMAPAQVKAYRSMLQDFYYEVKEDDNVLAAQVIHMKQKLQQISRGFLLDKDNDRVVELVEPDKNPTIKLLKNLIEDTPGKVLVFTHYTYSNDLLYQMLRPFGAVCLRGGMSQDELEDAKFQFNNNPQIKVLVGLDKVTARGHTLLGTKDQRCSTSIFYETSYNLEERTQIEDRNHRWGQDRAVSYIDLHCCAEDKAIARALQSKTNLVEAIVNAVRQYPRMN